MIHKQKKLVEFVDWAGVALVIIAYAGSVLGWLSPTERLYLVMNVVGSAGIAYGSFKKRDTQPVILNLVWILIALIGLLRI